MESLDQELSSKYPSEDFKSICDSAQHATEAVFAVAASMSKDKLEEVFRDWRKQKALEAKAYEGLKSSFGVTVANGDCKFFMSDACARDWVNSTGERYYNFQTTGWQKRMGTNSD